MKGKIIVLGIVFSIFLAIQIISPLLNDWNLQKKISGKLETPFVTLGKLSLRGREFTSFNLDDSNYHTLKGIWYRGYIGWIDGKIHIVEVAEVDEVGDF